jgi:hypothetical protein
MPVQSNRQTEILNNIFAGGNLARQPQVIRQASATLTKARHGWPEIRKRVRRGAVGFGRRYCLERPSSEQTCALAITSSGRVAVNFRFNSLVQTAEGSAAPAPVSPGR